MLNRQRKESKNLPPPANLLNNTGSEKAVAQFIAENNLFAAKEKVLLAVSGGVDSMGLMVILSRLKKAGTTNAEFIAAHINHQLRGADSLTDEEFVIAQAEKFDIPLKIQRVNVQQYSSENKLSIETAARNLRMKALCEIAQENKCTCIATAHQKNDNAETIIHRLMRGTSFRGLAGIWPKRQFANGIYFVRPLLNTTRDDIKDYLRMKSLDWRTDKSNYDYKYTRNRIRHQLLPALEKDSQKPLIDQLAKLAHNSCKLSNKLNNETQKIWPVCAIDNQQTEITLDLKVFLSQPKLIQAELIRHALVSIGSGEQNLSAKHYAEILKLAELGQTGKKLELPCRFIIQKEYETIRFAARDANLTTLKGITLNIPGETTFGNWRIEAKFLNAGQCDFDKFRAEKNSLIEWFDAAKVSLPLMIRPCRDDDRFQPLGLMNEKKVSKFLADAKIVQSRANVIYNEEMIIWLSPIRIAETTKIDESTSKILQIQVINL